MSNDIAKDFPTPKFIEGGCLCGAIRYQVDFPESHDFIASSSTCECTQCRKQTSSLFLITHEVPNFAFAITSDTTTLKNFRVPNSRADRGFCSACGSLIYWKRAGADVTDFTVGTVDPLYLIGEGADGQTVPKGGYGMALASGKGNHWWCENAIAGVTDSAPMLGAGRGTRHLQN